jgi:hypothetical protein
MPEPMPLSTGARLGPYEIVAAIGAGGLGARGERAKRVEPPLMLMLDGR